MGGDIGDLGKIPALHRKSLTRKLMINSNKDNNNATLFLTSVSRVCPKWIKKWTWKKDNLYVEPESGECGEGHLYNCN